MRRSNELASCTDDDLLLQAKAGVDAACIELCTRHQRMAFAAIMGILKNREDAEDAFQESLLRVYLHIHGFKEHCKFSTWFTRIAINTALMSRRKRRSRPTESFDAFENEECAGFRSLVSPGPSPEAEAARLQTSARLQRAIERLPLTLRGVTAIRQTEDLSIAEVAAVIGISVSAAKSRLLRSRAYLAAAVRDENRVFSRHAAATPQRTS